MEDGRQRKTYDRQFKLDAVRLVTEGKRSVREVAAEIGIDPNLRDHRSFTVVRCSQPSGVATEVISDVQTLFGASVSKFCFRRFGDA